jgi:hypothetical protein
MNGPPDPSPYQQHNHEFRLTHESPVFEDGAAIFIEACEWVEILGSVTSERHDETFYNEGAECDETRSYRMELDELYRNGELWLSFPLDRELTTEEEIAIMELAETANEGNAVIEELDPDPDDGCVIVSYNNLKIIYKA